MGLNLFRIILFVLTHSYVSPEDAVFPLTARKIPVTAAATVSSSTVTVPPVQNETLAGNGSEQVFIHRAGLLPKQSGLVVEAAGSGTTLTLKNQTVTTNYTMSELRGRTLRVIGLVEQPFVNYFNLTSEAKAAHNDTGPGIVMDILREIGNKYNLKYELLDTAETMWGSNENGNWTGLIGMMQRKEADILAGATIIRSDRHDVLEFPYPFHGSETGMMILSPDQNIDNTFLIVTAPFRVSVWLVTFGVIVVSGLIFKALCKALNEASEVQYTVLGSVWVFFSVFVQQGLPVQPTSWTCRTMLAFWWLAALTLVATFTGNMVALFAVSRSSLPFKTQEEMVDKVVYGNYKVAMTNATDTRMLFIKNSELELFKNLWYEMDVNKKWINVTTLTDGVQEVIKRRSVILFGPKETLQVLDASDCNVTTLDNGLIPVWYSIALQKDSPYTDIFSKEIQVLVENGFITKWLNDYQFKLSSSRGRRCVFLEGISTAGEAITKERAQGAFWILLAGLCLGCAAFSYEGICSFFKRLFNKLMRRGHVTNLQQSSMELGHDKIQFTVSNFAFDQLAESVNSYRPSGVVTTISKPEDTENRSASVKWRKKSIVRF